MRLFVSRQDADHRRLRNEKELVSLLASRLGVTPIVPGELSVREQIKLFSQAELVVGIHGAGMSNIVFCHPGASVVEICLVNPDHPEIVSSLYQGLSSTCNLRHGIIIGSQGDENDDFSIYIPKVLELCEKLLNPNLDEMIETSGLKKVAQIHYHPK